MSIGILPNVNSIKRNRVVSSAQSADSRTTRLKEQPNKKPKKGNDKGAVGIVKRVSQDTEPPDSATISWKGTTVLETIRRVRFTRAALRQANIRENKGPSLEKYKTKILISEVPTLGNLRTDLQEKLQDKSDAPTETRRNLPRKSISTKKEDKTAFYSPCEEWVLTAASTINPEEREFVVDSGAIMHMVSKKDLNSADLETVRISRNPTTLMRANDEVLAKEEATVYVQELDLFVKVMLLEETPAVLSLGKLREDHGYSYHWTSGAKPHLTKNGKRNDCMISNHVPFVHTYFLNIFITGFCF